MIGMMIGWLAGLALLARAEIWTQADESRRIAQLKQEESRAFEMQMRGQNPFTGNAANLYGSGGGGVYGNSQSHYGYDPYIGPIGHESGRPLVASHHNLPVRSRQSKAQLELEPASVDVKTTRTWCFTCMSPWRSVHVNMQRVVRNLLEVRRAHGLPGAFITPDCSQPKNVSALKKQDCALSYCQTLTLTDHDTATSFTIRGCAEKFGAVEEESIKKRGDNVCKRLHDSVDIQECICKNRKFCYTGSARDLGYAEDAEAQFSALKAGSARSSAWPLLLLGQLTLCWTLFFRH